MASKAVMDAITARLADGWSHCPVTAPNTSSQAPDDGSPFLDVQYPVSNETIISLGPVGQRVFREEGAVRFVLNVQSGMGLDDPSVWIDDLRNLFRAAQFSGVNCDAASPAAIDDGNDNGNYFQLRVIVPYWADILA